MGTSEPAHPGLAGTGVRVEETQGSSAEQTGARDEAGQHLLTALAALFPAWAFLLICLFFPPFARTLCLTLLAESAVLSLP